MMRLSRAGDSRADHVAAFIELSSQDDRREGLLIDLFVPLQILHLEGSKKYRRSGNGRLGVRNAPVKVPSAAGKKLISFLTARHF